MKDSIAIVSDPGVDDMVALVLLDKQLPGGTKQLISTFGNVAGELTAKNARDFVRAMAGGWQFQKGADLPLNGTVEYPWADYYHGKDGLWNERPPAADAALRPLRTLARDVISLGPTTEIANMLDRTPPLRLTLMGGAFDGPGNETEFAEVNMAFDADAANAVFANCQNIEVAVVPLEVTRLVAWPLEWVQKIPEDTLVNSWLKRMLIAWFKNYDHEKEKDFTLFDPLAVYLRFYPDAAIWKRSGVRVVVAGERRGQTVYDDANPPCAIATGLNEPEKIAADIYELLFGIRP